VGREEEMRRRERWVGDIKERGLGEKWRIVGERQGKAKRDS
jgi:hypothetical protein